MNAIELFHKDGRTAGVFYCEKCRIVHRTQADAEQCCRPYQCKKCGKECRQYWTICGECEAKEQAEKEAARFAAAEKLAEWDGPVYCEGLGYSNGYFATLDDLHEYLDDQKDDGEEVSLDYVWTCTSNHFAVADIDDILERIGEQGYEDFDVSDLGGIHELKKAIEVFNEENKDVVSWDPDFSRAVLIKKEAA